MTPERHRQISDLYHRTLALPTERRREFLDEACGDDAELRTEVESLLAADEAAGDFMSTPAMDVAARLLSDTSPPFPSVVGRYRLLSVLGRGGMGEVHLAEDTILGRKIAIKLLAAPLMADPRAVARFEQEARAASSLNHPNIVTIHEIGTVDGGRFIAMEFVEGQPLCAFVGQPMPPDMLLPLARQLAQALSVAHAAGIVHRDIKPENVMVRPDGYVKLLDFGVARLVGEGTGGHIRRPTLTRAGLAIGTPRYMSPEQIRGEPATAASDIFSLGALLYELTTGRHHSEAASAEATTGATDSPSSLLNLLHRMLALDPLTRPPSTEVESQIRILERGDAPAAPASEQDARRSDAKATLHFKRRRRAVAVIALVALAAALAFAFVLTRNPPPRQHASAPIRFQIVPPRGTAFSHSSASLALAPDGQSLAFTASDGRGQLALWVQPLQSLEARKLPGTDGAGQIFWSSDARTLAFAATGSESAFMIVDVDGGIPQRLGDRRLGQVGTWSPDRRTILMQGVAEGHQTIQLVPLDGASPTQVTVLDDARGETGHLFPSFLPDGRHFIFLARSRIDEHDGVAYLASIDSTSRTPLFKSDSQVVYASPGYLLYMRGNTLLAQPFDPSVGRVTPEAIPVADQVERNTASRRGAFTVSQTGVLAYRELSETSLVWFDRNGRRLHTLGPPGHYRNPALSRDGKTLAVGRLDPQTGRWDVWTIDLERNAAVRLTSSTSIDDMPVWSPDDQSIAFKSDREIQARGIGLYRQRVDGVGAAELLVGDLGPSTALHAWSLEGLVYSTARRAARYDLWRLPLTGDRKPIPILQSAYTEAYGRPSPDGRWIAYASDESGHYEVYAASLPHGQGKWPISAGGGTEPAWRGDGKEVFYLAPDGRLMAVPVRAASSFQASSPHYLFKPAVSPLVNPSYTRNQYAVTADGQRFLVTEPSDKPSLSAVTVIVNWPAGLRHESGS